MNVRPRIGILWGDFASSTPTKLGKLWSMGRVAHDITRALQDFAHVIPYQPAPQGTSFSFDRTSTAHQEELAIFLGSIDILWADLYPASALALTLRAELDLSFPAILFAGGVMPKGAEAMLFPWQHFLRAEDTLLFTSKADQAIWKRLISWSTLREGVIPLSVDESVFAPQRFEEREGTREKHHLSAHAPLLLYVGRLNIQKNLHTLFYLLAALSKQLPEVCLCLVGEEDSICLGEFAVRNTGYVAWLRQLAADLNIADRVIFPGPLFGKDLADLYAAADVVVNFSLYHRENFGLSQAEAASCGVPVICSAWGGFKDVVETGVTGYTVDTVLTKHGIKVNWGQAISPLLHVLQHKAHREEMGKKAHSLAQERFSMNALRQNLATLVTVAQQPSTNTSRPVYQPSLFAKEYEQHKRACGWYAAEEEHTWYPPMFQGASYALYEQLMAPYASQLASDLQPHQIEADWRPYFPSQVRFDPSRLLLSDEDPIWPHRRFLTPLEGEIIRTIDGRYSVAMIVQQQHKKDQKACRAILWELYLEGFILFANHDIHLSLLSR
ncbi:hypothetical protein KTT_50300 [Tengunoibacter tsumagoiensis]|uniref:Glycosyl transferase family 1 domain-containing protein n=2 Tax=Tengunoibacter tsumagoiensis TaxID=2014871 RepID=A0A402A882_9CHLR|nr:hypothetical protein KTT_50300 [Tengunoibacter tsumagoiensis]